MLLRIVSLCFNNEVRNQQDENWLSKSVWRDGVITTRGKIGATRLLIRANIVGKEENKINSPSN